MAVTPEHFEHAKRMLKMQIPDFCMTDVTTIVESRSCDYNVVLKDVEERFGYIRKNNKLNSHHSVALIVLAAHQGLEAHVMKLLSDWDCCIKNLYVIHIGA
jgi:hypothetical protein